MATSRHDADPETVAHAIALRLLEARPRTRSELAQALARRQTPETAAESVLDRLQAVGLIDDEAFAQAWVESRHAGRGLGRRALGSELRRKGIEPALIDTALGAVSSADEAEIARQLVERKLRSMNGLDEATKSRRLFGMLARKGIPAGLAQQAIRSALRGEVRQ